MRRRRGDGTREDHVIVGVAHDAREQREVGKDQERYPEYSLEHLHISSPIYIALLQAWQGEATAGFFEDGLREATDEPVADRFLQDRVGRPVWRQKGAHQDGGVKHGARWHRPGA